LGGGCLGMCFVVGGGCWMMIDAAAAAAPAVRTVCIYMYISIKHAYRDGDLPARHRQRPLGVKPFRHAHLVPIYVCCVRLCGIGTCLVCVRRHVCTPCVCVYNTPTPIPITVSKHVYIHTIPPPPTTHAPMRRQRPHRAQPHQSHRRLPMPPRPRVAHRAFQGAEGS
jgi:hypothetical protein